MCNKIKRTLKKDEYKLAILIVVLTLRITADILLDTVTDKPEEEKKAA